MSKQKYYWDFQLIFTFSTSQMFFKLYLPDYGYQFQATDGNLWNCMQVKLYDVTDLCIYYVNILISRSVTMATMIMQMVRINSK